MGQQESVAEQLKKLRERLGLSQAQFASRYHLSVESLRNWEQKQRSNPAGSLLPYLYLIEQDPEGVAETLQNFRSPK